MNRAALVAAALFAAVYNVDRSLANAIGYLAFALLFWPYRKEPR